MSKVGIFKVGIFKVGISESLLIPSEHKILNHIYHHGPMTAYTLSKETRYSEKTAYAVTKTLVKKKMLTRRVIGQTRARMDKIEYSLTLIGLSSVFIPFLGEPNRWNDNWTDAMTWWEHLAPFVLGKWNFLITVDKKYAVEQLAHGSWTFFAVCHFGKKVIKHTFAQYFFGVFDRGFVCSDTHFDWLRRLAGRDPEIRDFVMKSLEQEQSLIQDRLRLLKEDSG